MTAKRLAAWLAALILLATPVMAEDDTAQLPTLGVQVKMSPRPTQTPETAAEDAPQTTDEPQYATLGERILWRGMEGEDVRQLQVRLIELGYYTGNADGIFGLNTSRAVYAFQRKHQLKKIDGKVGEETLSRMFAEDAIPVPTPTPTPTPKPTPTPTPTPTPVPTPVPTPTPDVANAPFEMRTQTFEVGGHQAQMFVGSVDGETIYPLGAVMMRLGCQVVSQTDSWQIALGSDEDGEPLEEMALSVGPADETGLCAEAMGASGGEIFLADEASRVYTYSGEAYVTRAMLAHFGVSVGEGDVPVIVLDRL